MKTTIILFLISTNLFSQEVENFKIVDSNIIWETKIAAETTIEDLLKKLKLSGNFTDLEIIDNTLIGNLQDRNIDYKSFGYAYMHTDMYVTIYRYSAFLTISKSENEYQIKLKKIEATPTVKNYIADVNNAMSLETIILRKNNTEFHKRFINKNAEMFNATFLKLFN
jgi:hypothetical protein